MEADEDRGKRKRDDEEAEAGPSSGAPPPPSAGGAPEAKRQKGLTPADAALAAAAAIGAKVGGWPQSVTRAPDHALPSLASHVVHLIVTGAGEVGSIGSGVLELEAKIGLICAKDPPHDRVALGAASDVLLASGAWTRFKSELDMETWLKYNRLFNDRAVAHEFEYKHPVVVDKFYAVPGYSETVRATYVVADGVETLSEVMVKRRIGDLNVRCMSSPHDIRISTSAEIALAHSVLAAPGTVYHAARDRRKDRRSYTFGPWSLDLTIVSSSSRPETNELELELVDTAALAAAVQAYHAGYRAPLFALADAFLRIARELAQVHPGTDFVALAAATARDTAAAKT